MQFPENFTWGVAAAAYQIEGASSEEGKGLSVWDEFCKQPGKVLDGHNGDVACDHYHRYSEDVAMIAQLGVRNYRFSISWPRVIPSGTGAVNERGLAFYDKLVDTLLAAGITPWATLFHWDFPQALMSRGGWLNRDSADWFADYTRVVVERLSDRVRNWMTLNEPQCFIGFGHATGTNAPGLKLCAAECLKIGHHVLLAHGKAVRVLRTHACVPANVGWAPVGVVSLPDTEDASDVGAARSSMFSVSGGDASSMAMPPNIWSNTWWGDPVVFGRYPEDGIKAAGAAMPAILKGDMETISEPIDFYGANIYSGTRYRAGENGEPERVAHSASTPLSAFKWPIIPASLRWGPRFLHERYQLPIIVTENGISLSDWVSLDGKVHDPQRIDFLTRYLTDLSKAMDDGADVRGYFHWSIMDNFEWAEGYKQRFGLVHVDYETQQRTPKDSAYWYRDLIAAHTR
ncbi:MAG: beta-glucosidase [Gloeobacteraceae cyanobacterium ES-bin-144]|nr:beta-glucosidase [Verrucomicrobiales bacterium]